MSAFPCLLCQSLIAIISQIESINNVLTKATSVLRQAHNERSPLSKLPVEILQKILELVPDSCIKRWRDFRPFWRNTLLDSSMLIPVTHTCRRLREVALAHPHLWTTFQISLKKLPLVRQMAAWSERIPLNATGPDIGMLGGLPLNTRFGSIHLYDIGDDDFGLLPTVIGQSSSPALHSFSLFCGETHRWDSEGHCDTLPLYPEQAPNLRYLTLDEVEALPDKGFSCLTHLALIDFTSYTVRSTSPYEFHARLVEFIRECPRLECVVLIGFVLPLGGEDVLNEPSLIPLHHLKHVTLCNFSTDALKYYVALLQPRVNMSSIQILGYHSAEPSFQCRFLLPPDLDEPEAETQKQICIGMHPTTPASSNYAISLTTISSRSTRRLAAWKGQLMANGMTPCDWPPSVLSQCPTSPRSPLPVDEVWLYGFSTTVFPRRCSPLMHFPHAARVVVAIDRRLHHDDVPTLLLLPSAHDPLPGPIAIATLRLVHGFSEPDEPYHKPSKFNPDPTAKYHLALGQLIKDLQSGEYGYLKHFVLQVTPHMYVDEKELDQVKDAGRFGTFTFERIKKFPEMPGHSDPARHERFPSSLW